MNSNFMNNLIKKDMKEKSIFMLISGILKREKENSIIIDLSLSMKFLPGLKKK